MDNVEEKYLPIGTVVKLKGNTKRLMISGFCSARNSQRDKIYDYSGCKYPEGFLVSNQVYLFNHEDIEQIYYLGLIDEEEEKFKIELKKQFEEFQKKNANKSKRKV